MSEYAGKTIVIDGIEYIYVEGSGCGKCPFYAQTPCVYLYTLCKAFHQFRYSSPALNKIYEIMERYNDK